MYELSTRVDAFWGANGVSAAFLILVLYPLLCVIVPDVFYFLWPKRRGPVQNVGTESLDAGDKAVVLGASISLFMYASLISGTWLWHLLFSVSSDTGSFFANARLRSVVIGGYLGVSWAGVSIWLLALGAATGRMHREIRGLRAPLKTQIAVWLAGASAEEMWRVTAIMALVGSGSAPTFSVVVVSIFFGAGYLPLGIQRVATACLEGAFFAFLFLWQGSFLAPFAAHLAVQAVYLWGVGEFSQDQQRRKTWQIPGTKCPVCQTQLKLLQIKLSEEFVCPSCKAQLSLSDGYQNVMRFAAAFGFCSLILCTLVLLNSWLPGNIGAWLTYPVSYGFATSGLFLYRRTFTRLFPPRLQRGTPYFIGLNLKDRGESDPKGGEDDVA